MTNITTQIMRCIVGACDDTCIYYCDDKPHCGMSEIEFQEINDWLDGAQEALEKADKYRWHDLRKNPDDLPVLSKVEIVMECDDEAVGYWSKRETGKGYYNPQFCAWIWSDRTTWVGKNEIKKDEKYEWLKVIAWKYADEFEEVEE